MMFPIWDLLTPLPRIFTCLFGGLARRSFHRFRIKLYTTGIDNFRIWFYIYYFTNRSSTIYRTYIQEETVLKSDSLLRPRISLFLFSSSGSRPYIHADRLPSSALLRLPVRVLVSPSVRGTLSPLSPDGASPEISAASLHRWRVQPSLLPASPLSPDGASPEISAASLHRWRVQLSLLPASGPSLIPCNKYEYSSIKLQIPSIFKHLARHEPNR